MAILDEGAVKLLDCPFCGATKAMMFEPTCRPETPYNPADRLFPIVRCMACYCEVAGENEDYRGGTAIAAWNSRVPALFPAADIPSPGSGWQDIASAPKDGTPFLAYVPDDTFSPITGIEVYWFEGDQLSTSGPPAPRLPTHWMPLPASPANPAETQAVEEPTL